MNTKEKPHDSLVVDPARHPSPLTAAAKPDCLALPIARRSAEPGATFEAELIAELPFLCRYARSLTRDWDRAADLVQDTCEKALRRRELFRDPTNLRAWLVTIMRHHRADLAKRRDALASGQWLPLDDVSEVVGQPPRAEQICLLKEALRLAADGLSREEASVFWPAVAGAGQRDCAALLGVPPATAGTRLHRARSFMRHACAA